MSELHKKTYHSPKNFPKDFFALPNATDSVGIDCVGLRDKYSHSFSILLCKNNSEDHGFLLSAKISWVAIVNGSYMPDHEEVELLFSLQSFV